MKNNKQNKINKQTKNTKGNYPKQQHKPVVLFFLLVTAVLLSSCQSIPEKSAKADIEEAEQAPNIVKTELSATKPPEPVTSTEKTNSIPKKAQPDYAQSIPPMSESTKKHLKKQAHELMGGGSMPKLNYQIPDKPGLQGIASTTGNTDTALEKITLDYEQVEIRQILEEIADSLSLSIIIDPSISGRVTMRTAPNADLTKKDLWPILQMILSEAGVVLERRGDIYHAKRSAQLLPSTIGIASSLQASDESRVMQITPLKHISIDAAMTVLKPMAAPKGGLVPIPSLNTLLIVDKPEQIKRFNGLLSIIDTDPFKNRGIQLYKIKVAEAKDVAKELQEVLTLIEGKKPAYQVMGLSRINALLVVAPPGRGFRDVSRWVEILDAGEDETLIEQLFIYRCKSLKATSLADTLNAIFKQEQEKSKNKKKTVDDDPNKFKTTPKEELSVKAVAERNAKQPKTPTHSATEEVASANINVTIVADEDSNSLLVRTTARDYKHLLETIRILDVVPLQVLINVVIAQVTLTDAQSFGIDWAYLGSSGTTLQTNFGQAQSVGPNGDPLGLILNRITGNWRVTLNALAKESDVNILSRPSLLITNNQEGIINVGKEVPVETSNTTNTSSTVIDGGTNVTQQIAYRKTGIELTVTPQINEDGIVNMVIKQALSAIEGQTSGAEAGLNPTFTNQEISTTVIVEDKETIILGGLIESVEVEGESGVPILKDIPLMGNLFKSNSTQMERRELILIISTNILNINDDNQKFNEAFKSRYYAAAKYLDKQIQDEGNEKN